MLDLSPLAMPHGSGQETQRSFRALDPLEREDSKD